MKLVLYWDDKIERLRLGRSRSADQISMGHSPQTTWFAILNPEWSSFPVYLTSEWNFVPEREFLNLLWTDLYRSEISSRYNVNKHRILYRVGMNLSQNESHSGIMWIAPKRQISPLVVYTGKFCATIFFYLQFILKNSVGDSFRKTWEPLFMWQIVIRSEFPLTWRALFWHVTFPPKISFNVQDLKTMI